MRPVSNKLSPVMDGRTEVTKAVEPSGMAPLSSVPSTMACAACEAPLAARVAVLRMAVVRRCLAVAACYIITELAALIRSIAVHTCTYVSYIRRGRNSAACQDHNGSNDKLYLEFHC